MAEQEVNKEEQQQETVAPENEAAQKLAEAEQQVLQYKDLLLRKAAEFENYKKRAENESALIVKFANEELLLELLPIVDDLERSLKLSKEKKDFESFYKGIELIYQKTIKLLADQGVTAMETVGKEFNVDYHDALMQVPKSDVPPHTILEEVEKGYTLNNKILRHAKVVVSTAPPTEAEQQKATSQQSDHPEKPAE
jgi:molecular chaperone GrpE